jgi:hypothetical protein
MIAHRTSAFWTYLSLVLGMAADADRYTGPWRVRTAHPALILNNRYDPATAYLNAVRMSELLTGSRLVIVEGWGHTTRETSSTCANRTRALPCRPVASPTRDDLPTGHRAVCSQVSSDHRGAVAVQ